MTYHIPGNDYLPDDYLVLDIFSGDGALILSAREYPANWGTRDHENLNRRYIVEKLLTSENQWADPRERDEAQRQAAYWAEMTEDEEFHDFALAWIAWDDYRP